MNLFPAPNNPGTGVGGFTNNYKRQEDRTFARDNWDTKVNWNRTSAHQIWGKFSYMNATVDDLTNYLGPDPNASGDGGFTKVYQATAGQTWTFTPDAADGHDVRIRPSGSARATVLTSRPETSASTCWGFPARTTRATATSISGTGTRAIRSSTSPRSARSATVMDGIRSTATSARIRSRRTSRR